MGVKTQEGTFNIFGYNTPDIGLSEMLGVGAQNPDVINSGAALYQPVVSPVPGNTYATTGSQNFVDPNAQAGFVQTRTENRGTGQVNGAQTSTNPNPNPTPQPSRPGDSELQQLLKMAQDGSINPSQRSRLAELLTGQQQQQQQDYASQISESYEPYKKELTNMEGTLQSGFDEQSANLESSAINEAKKYDTQGQELTQGTQTEEAKFRQTLQSALSEAIRSYNALKQQATARFGGASSAGQAVGELANQEFLRQQGQTQQAGVEGSAKFGVEYGKIKSYVQQKKDDLDQFKKEALAQLRDNLNKGLNEIRLRKADVEANKTKDRLALLQSTIEQARNMSLQDQQFRQQLGLAAVSKLQEVSGRQFTPQEWSSYINGFMNEMKSSSPTQVGTGAVATSGAATPLAYNPTRKTNQDELQALQNQGFA